MVTVTVNKDKIKCPLTWGQCSTHIYQRLIAGAGSKGLSRLQAFCLIVNKEYQLIAESTDEKLEAAVHTVTDFVFNEPRYFEEFPPPGSVTIMGTEVEIPRKLGRLTIEQNCIIRGKMAKQGVCLEELISWAVAVYLQPLITNTPFNVDDAERIEQEVGRLPIYETFPIGFFYLSKLNNFGALGLLGWLQIKRKRTSSYLLSPKRPESISSRASMI